MVEKGQQAAATSSPTKKLIRAMVPHESTAPGVVPRGSTLLRYGSPGGTAEPDAGEASCADRESWTLLGDDGKVVESAERYQAYCLGLR